MLRYASTQYNHKFLNNIYYEKTRELLEFYLNRPYKFILDKNNEVLIQRCTWMVNAATGFISPVLFMFGSVLTTTLILSFLIIYKPYETISLLVLLSLFYFLAYKKLKSKILKLGQQSTKYINDAGKIIGNSFGSFKESKITQNYNYFLLKFKKIALNHRNASDTLQAFQILPAHLIEVVAFAILIFISLFLYVRTNGLSDIIPIIGVFAISLKRLIPAIQLIYNNFVQIKFHIPTFDKIYTDLKKSHRYFKNKKINLDKKNISFKKFISFQNVKYNYERKKNKINLNINTKIPKNIFLGVCGSTGHGKTTFIDLMLGLLKPKSGIIKIDDKLLDDTSVDSWQKIIAYAPQKGYLIDDTVENNIIFGKKNFKSKISIKNICKIVEIDKFINKNLKNKYKTLIGDKGVRLSGGEQQRLILARTLYRNPKVLVIDEATSGIDMETERKIIANIKKHFRDLTIIFVTHRSNSLKYCDKILFVENGKISFYEKLNFLKKKYKSFFNDKLIKNESF